LIYGLATGDPGRKKDYLLPLSEAKLMKYINAAQKNGFLVIIDTQLGAETPSLKDTHPSCIMISNITLLRRIF
jgi:hypothetical protein